MVQSETIKGSDESRKTRQKQLAENISSKLLGEKLVEKQLTKNSPAENSSQVQIIIVDTFMFMNF